MPETDIVLMKPEAMLAGVSGNKPDPIDGGEDNLAKPVGIDEGFEDDDMNSTNY